MPPDHRLLQRGRLSRQGELTVPSNPPRVTVLDVVMLIGANRDPGYVRYRFNGRSTQR